MERKIIYFDEYTVDITYDKDDKSIEIQLLDKLGDIIESLTVSE